MKRTLALSVVLAASAAASANPIVNGNFETGVIGPSTSAYAQSGSMIPPETWNIVSFDTIHGSWVDFYDHTHGNANGHYMIINGSDSGVGPAWAQTVAVNPGETYDLSAWFASLFPDSVATLEWRIIGNVSNSVSATFMAPLSAGNGGPGLGVWVQNTFQFSTGANTLISIELWDVSGIYQGNDYALDDVELTLVPAPASAGLLGLAGLAARRRRR